MTDLELRDKSVADLERCYAFTATAASMDSPQPERLWEIHIIMLRDGMSEDLVYIGRSSVQSSTACFVHSSCAWPESSDYTH
jgi:hypothetical protein